ncbi:hypothetical protein DYE48_20960, partial [Halobacillus trueperi]
FFMRTFPRPCSHALFVQDPWLKRLYNGVSEQVFITELGRLLLGGFREPHMAKGRRATVRLLP